MSERSEQEPTEIEEADGSAGSGLGRIIKVALIVFALLLLVIALASWLGGDSSTLPLDYDGFD